MTNATDRSATHMRRRDPIHGEPEIQGAWPPEPPPPPPPRVFASPPPGPPLPPMVRLADSAARLGRVEAGLRLLCSGPLAERALSEAETMVAERVEKALRPCRERLAAHPAHRAALEAQARSDTARRQADEARRLSQEDRRLAAAALAAGDVDEAVRLEVVAAKGEALVAAAEQVASGLLGQAKEAMAALAAERHAQERRAAADLQRGHAEAEERIAGLAEALAEAVAEAEALGTMARDAERLARL